jgi:hypothetical protein
MTAAARIVLADCEEALAEIADGVQGGAWRRRWITTVVLLRVVGHVLDKVDSMRSAAHKRAIADGWTSLQRSKPEPAIFWGFIDEERNSILKEYRLSAGQGVTVRPGGVSVNLRTGEQHASEGLPPIYHYVINDGQFKGRDQRDVLREAIEWWRSYLDAIDRQVASCEAEQGAPGDARNART